MMLMDGQLSHIGFDTRCRLPSALLAADDGAGDEDMTRQSDLQQNNAKRSKIRRGIRMVGWRNE